MDEIRFEIVPSEHSPGVGELRILINGRSLDQIAAAVELPFAEKEGAPSLAGAYSGLRADKDVLLPSRHFFGEPSWTLYEYAEGVQVLGCECGEPGCWPLVCVIEAQDDVVVWREFRQPQRQGRDGTSRWSYEGLGPFRFRRSQYELALGELEARDPGGWEGAD